MRINWCEGFRSFSGNRSRGNATSVRGTEPISYLLLKLAFRIHVLHNLCLILKILLQEGLISLCTVHRSRSSARCCARFPTRSASTLIACLNWLSSPPSFTLTLLPPQNNRKSKSCQTSSLYDSMISIVPFNPPGQRRGQVSEGLHEAVRVAGGSGDSAS